MQSFEITIAELGESFRCREGQTLLTGMESLGRRGIPVGCRGGGCGVCKVHIDRGDFKSMKMSRAHVTRDEEDRGYVLACRCRPHSDLEITVVGKMKRAVHGKATKLEDD